MPSKRVNFASSVSIFTVLALSACSKKEGTGATDAGSATAAATPSASAVSPPTPETPRDVMNDYQKTLIQLVEDGHYANACKGEPWFPSSICQWVAARADGKSVERPDGEVFRSLFTREHWKHVYGQVLSDPDPDGNYEVSVGGYRRHCILDTDETRFSSKGHFDMWVQEEPETREITLNSGATAQWVVLAEATLAKTLMDLGHSGGGIEATALAKDAMKLIANYDTYAMLKGEIPSPPGTPAATGASPSGTGSAPGSAGNPPPPSSRPKGPPATTPASRSATAAPVACQQASLERAAGNSQTYVMYKETCEAQGGKVPPP